MIGQLNFSGRDKVENAIYWIKQFEPKDGYYLAFSGGKDSVVVKALCDMAGVKYDAHYNLTSVDPPELVRFIKTFSDVKIEIPTYKDGSRVTMWNLIPKKKMPPTRIVRYCCQYLKEGGGENRFKITGVRKQESTRRLKTRAGLEVAKSKSGKRDLLDPDNPNQEVVHICRNKAQRILNPIIEWSNEDVWEFIHAYSIPYCSLYDQGYKRLGCIGCPMSSNKAKELDEYPKFKEAYKKAFFKMLEQRRIAGLETVWESPDEVMEWWIGD